LEIDWTRELPKVLATFVDGRAMFVENAILAPASHNTERRDRSHDRQHDK
jgi:hypothetical protein